MEMTAMAGRDMKFGGSKLAARTVMQSRDFDPIERLLDVYEAIPDAPETSQLRATILLGLMPYVHPKLSQVALVGDESSPIRVTHEIVRNLLRDPNMARNVIDVSVKMEELTAAAEEATASATYSVRSRAK